MRRRILVTVECEVRGETEADLAYARRCLLDTGAERVSLDHGRYGEQSYTIRPVRITSVRRARSASERGGRT